MDIFLSVNNREEVLQIPIIPSSFTIAKPQTTNKFETMSGEEILLIGAPKLKGISIESFFPLKNCPYIHHTYNPNMWGWDYVYTINRWIEQKLPIRLIITYESSDTPINMPVAVTNFEYSIKTDGDLWYKLDFEQMNLLGYDNPIPWYGDVEEEIDMEELEKLRTTVEQLTAIVNELANPFIYNYIDANMPEWAHEAVQAAVDKGIIQGDGGGLGLDYKDLRHITMLYRLGLLN